MRVGGHPDLDRLSRTATLGDEVIDVALGGRIAKEPLARGSAADVIPVQERTGLVRLMDEVVDVNECVEEVRTDG